MLDSSNSICFLPSHSPASEHTIQSHTLAKWLYMVDLSRYLWLTEPMIITLVRLGHATLQSKKAHVSDLIQPRCVSLSHHSRRWFWQLSLTSLLEQWLKGLGSFNPATLPPQSSLLPATWMREGCGKFRLLHARVVIIIFIFQIRRHVYCPRFSRLVSGRFQTNITALTLLSIYVL